VNLLQADLDALEARYLSAGVAPASESLSPRLSGSITGVTRRLLRGFQCSALSGSLSRLPPFLSLPRCLLGCLRRCLRGKPCRVCHFGRPTFRGALFPRVTDRLERRPALLHGRVVRVEFGAKPLQRRFLCGLRGRQAIRQSGARGTVSGRGFGHSSRRHDPILPLVR
jgi:hypothetical protein